MGEYDRVRFLDSSEPFSLRAGRGRETLAMIAVVRIERAVVLENGALVELRSRCSMRRACRTGRTAADRLATHTTPRA
ncbi:MAG: hypothetical protein MZV65_31720 [Chromatiales bacterium]|nr:hypothetical protein [Chromatiales bacterium]